MSVVTEEAMESETSGQEHAPAAEESPSYLAPLEESKSKAFKIERKRQKTKQSLFKRFRGGWPTAMRIDALSMLSAILGFMSLGMPWIREVSSSGEHYYTMWHYLTNDPDLDVLVFGLATAGILMGSMLALFSRIGGVVQLAGLVSFVTIALPSDSSYAFGLGFGAAAAALGVASMVLRRTFPFPERLRSIVRSPEDGSVTINVLSLIGGVLGILSLFLVWYHEVWTQTFAGRLWTQDYTLLQFASPYLATPWTTAAAICFAAGSILSILTPLGLIGQFVGISAFLYAMKDNAAYWGYFQGSGYYGYSPSSESSYAIGLYVGLACLLLVLGSIFLKWRLRLSGGMASSFISWPTRPSPHSLPLASSRKNPAPWRGLVPVLAQSIKMILVIIVVLIIAVAAAGLAYALPWSDVEILISNSDQNSRVHVSVYVDGEVKDVDFISSTTYYVKSFDVRAGDIKIALDYGFPDDSHGTDIDGVIDWSTWVKVKPLRLSAVSVNLGMDYLSAPVVALDVADFDNGWKSSVASVNENVTSFRSLSWSDMRMVLYDGINHVEWETQSTYFINGTMTEHAFFPQLLGNITVTCSVVDLLGNGYLDVGDFVLITSGTNYTFSSSVTYTLYLLYEPTSSLASEVALQGRY